MVAQFNWGVRSAISKALQIVHASIASRCDMSERRFVLIDFTNMSRVGCLRPNRSPKNPNALGWGNLETATTVCQAVCAATTIKVATALFL